MRWLAHRQTLDGGDGFMAFLQTNGGIVVGRGGMRHVVAAAATIVQT